MATELLDDLRRQGFTFEVVDDRLRVRPKDAVTAATRAALLEHKAELLAALAAEVEAIGWRAEAMRPQVPRRGSIPFLLARPRTELAMDAPGCCLTCGDPLSEGRRYRCPLCVRAVEQVLNEMRECTIGGSI